MKSNTLVYGGVVARRISGPSNQVQQIPKASGVMVSGYRPLSNEEIQKHAAGTAIFPETHQKDLLEQARRANELDFAVASYLANQCPENFELLKQARRLYSGEISIETYLDK